jgi:GT2 family glycosyltransferase
VLIFSIVNYYDDRNCETISADLMRAFPTSKVYVCSNSPTDASFVNSYRHTKSDVNLGYGAGHNLNLKHALEEGLGFDAIFFLNTDITFSVSDAKRVEGVARRERDSLAFFATTLPSGRPNVGFFVPFFTVYTNVPGSVVYAAGNFFGVSRRVASAPVFDERFFLYFEEVDLRFRYRRAPIFTLGEVKVCHEKSRMLDPSNHVSVVFAPRSRAIFALKYFGGVGYIVANIESVVFRLLRRLRSLLG